MPSFDYLGVSSRTKTAFDENGLPLRAEGFDNIIQAIARAISIDGDVFFLRSKKSRLQQLQFQQRDEVTASLLRYFLLRAMQNEVKQVAKASIEVFYPEDEPSRLDALITFTVKGSNAKGSMVYPYYLQNGNNNLM